MSTVSNTRIRIGTTLAIIGFILTGLDAAGASTAGWAACAFAWAWAIGAPSANSNRGAYQWEYGCNGVKLASGTADTLAEMERDLAAARKQWGGR